MTRKSLAILLRPACPNRPQESAAGLSFFDRIPAHTIRVAMEQRLDSSRQRRKLFASAMLLLLLLIYLLAALLSQSRSAEDYEVRPRQRNPQPPSHRTACCRPAFSSPARALCACLPSPAMPAPIRHRHLLSRPASPCLQAIAAINGVIFPRGGTSSLQDSNAVLQWLSEQARRRDDHSRIATAARGFHAPFLAPDLSGGGDTLTGISSAPAFVLVARGRC